MLVLISPSVVQYVQKFCFCVCKSVHVSEALVQAICALFCSCLCGKCSFQCHTTLSRASHALSIPLLSLQSLFTCFRGSHTSHTCSILLLSLQSLFTCFRGSHTSHTCSILLLSLQSLFTCFRGCHTSHTCSILLLSL